MPIIPVEEQERLRERRFVSYSYYDTPDGEDLHLKLLYTGKIAFLGGALFGLVNIYTAVPPVVGNLQRFYRFCRCVGPAIGVAAAFTTATFYATKLRGKNDELNYVIGGIAAGSVVGAVLNRPGTGFYASVLFSSIGYTKKSVELRNMKVINNSRQRKTLSSYYLRHWNFSLLPDDKRGNWTKELPKE